ncbi:MAG TPA: hypothetical protein VM285_05275 [Polyangia bacterium]|nr:hypothetical protein [Polyangia bacterium]
MADTRDAGMRPADAAAGPFRGEVVYIHAFDVAYDMKREPIENLLGRKVEEYSIGPTKRSPRYLFFYRPLMVKLPAEERKVRGRAVRITRTVKVFAVGAISIQMRVPFEVERLSDLVAYHGLAFDGVSLDDEMRTIAENVRRELEPYCVGPVGELRESEDYTAFAIESLPSPAERGMSSAEDWLVANRRQVAGLLTEEEDVAHLSRRKAEEATARYLSYYDDDLVVADWDAALLVGQVEDLEDVIHIMEVANVQLLELETYDRLLDGALEASYRDVARWRTRARRKVRRNLREIRVDLARLSDELVNISKFFGDWHLARIYQNVSARFHLAEWHRIIDEKLDTLAELYDMLQQDRVNFWMVILEITIVLLFIVDVVLLVMGRD